MCSRESPCDEVFDELSSTHSDSNTEKKRQRRKRTESINKAPSIVHTRIPEILAL